MTGITQRWHKTYGNDDVIELSRVICTARKLRWQMTQKLDSQ